MHAVRTSVTGVITVIGILVMLLCASALAQAQKDSLAPQGNGIPASSADSSQRSVDSAPAENQETQTGGADFSLLRTIGGFGIVLCMIALAYFAAKKFAPQYFVKQTAAKNLRLIESLSMGEKRNLTVVEFDERRFLLGNTPNQITLLAELPPQLAIRSDVQTPAALTVAAGKQTAAQESFKSIYAVERGPSHKPVSRHIPPDIRAKMRQLRESLER